MLASRRRNGPKHEHISGSIAVPTESVYGIEITLKRKKKKNRNMQWKTFTQKRNRIHNSFGCVGRAHVITQFYMRIRCAVMRLTISTTASSS